MSRDQILECYLVWSLASLLLIWGGALGGRMRSDLPIVAAYAGIATCLLAARLIQSPTRRRSSRAHGFTRYGGGRRRPLVAASLGLLAGFGGYPAWVATIYPIGQLLGLRAADFLIPWSSPALWAAAIVLAPLWEELLYREWMLRALRRTWGVVPAVVLSSAAFALPHFGGGSWALLGTFLVGLALAGVALVGRWIWLCVAVHAGLNLGALAWNHGPAWASLPPVVSALAGWVGLGAALWLLRRGAAEPRPAAGGGPVDLEAA